MLAEVGQLCNGILPLVHLLLGAGRQQGGVFVAEAAELNVAVGVHSPLVVVQPCRNHGEVEMDDKVGVALRGRVFSDVELSEEGVKLVLLIDVVVVFEHGEGNALAEAARADEEEILV